MMDALMIVLLVAAFVAAFGYVSICSRFVESENGTEDRFR
jgi:hypothetical protein